MSNIWKGIRAIVNLNNTSKKDIRILNKNGKNVTDPQELVNLFNEHYANVGPNIEKKLPVTEKIPRITKQGKMLQRHSS